MVMSRVNPTVFVIPYTDVSRLFSTDNTPSDNIAKQPSKVKAYMDLSKARLSTLVVATTAAGFVAAGGPLSPITLSCCCLGTALCSSSAAAFNQIFEKDLDARMKRTIQRPLVQGTLTITEATIAATTCGVAGTSVLAYTTDPVTTFLGASNIVLYAGLYTYMKPRSVYNTWVGAVVGAIPPVMGWTAATGGQLWDVEALLLGSTLYLWQMPHFFALSYMHRLDYARGGFQMVPVLESNGDETSRIITRYTWYLSSIPVLATLTDVTSSMFCYEGVVLNAYALHVAYKFKYDRTNANARKVFLTSLWYLPCLLMLFLLHSKTWDDVDEDKEENPLRGYISSYIHAVRDKGRQLCVHETAVAKTEDGEKACPVVLGQKATHQVAENATQETSLKESQA
jgi:protoheme IX farnesyltransferase